VAGNIKNKPNLKKTFASHKRIDEAIEAKTSYLSDEFKETINEVSGQNKAREKPLGDTQKNAVDKLNSERGSDGANQISSFEG
jgi:hypothetical protein